jgi:hypothetical protein
VAVGSAVPPTQQCDCPVGEVAELAPQNPEMAKSNPAHEPNANRFFLREVEQQLAAEIQAARQQLLGASRGEEKLRASEALNRALHRFTEFATRGIVPEEFGHRKEE